MHALTFQRGDVVAFMEKEEKKMAVNIQNGAGNRFAPTIIVAEVEFIPCDETLPTTVVCLQAYPNENMQMVVNLGKLKTIDKQRVQHTMGQLPTYVQRTLDQRLQQLFQFNEEKLAQVVFVDLGKDTLGSEQGGERPAIVLKQFSTQNEDNYFLVAVMTSKMAKRAIPTHVMYEEGEGGISKPSLALFEQLKYVKSEDVMGFYEYTPSNKLPNIRKAFHISVGLAETIRSGA